MPDHYYTAQPQSEHKPVSFDYEYRGQVLHFTTDSGVFSRTEIDRGTEVLLKALPQNLCGNVLDMGCGYGAIGVAIAKVWHECRVTMADINQRACELARENAAKNSVHAHVLESDGYARVMDRRFDVILQNPPIRAGKAVIYQMFADAAVCLAMGGSLWLVIRKQQGAPSAVSYLQTLFESVQAVEKKSGYWVLRCENPLEQSNERSEA
ncbi:MAG: class I SAM-dependent methyltransferase [Clostridia bacterium]